MPDRTILIDKPYRWTSFDVVKKLRKPLLEEKRSEVSVEVAKQIKNLKVGHAGTLDPLATGLLVLCSGKFTKEITAIQNAEKEYTGSIILGAVTASYDLETEPENFIPFGHIQKEEITRLANSFMGKQMQIPPIHSAKKIDGKRAYEKARKGEEFTLKGNEIEILTFEITGINLPQIDFRVVCSKGTYIRSLAHDFGQKLGTGAYLSALCRTRIGKYLLSDALTPESFLSQLNEKQII
jgi:tRNA pseudouridine55 synthase